MSLILNIETSTTVCSVALAENGKLLQAKEINSGYTHAENLTPFIQEVLKQANTGIKEIDAVAVSKGPGSYTGLRIGVSSAKGICYSLKKPLIAIETLKAMCLSPSVQSSADDSTLLCPMLDARRMEVYSAFYDQDLNEVRELRADIIEKGSYVNYLQKGRVLFFGPGAEKCKSALAHPNAVFLDGLFPSAQFMISLSQQAFDQKSFEDVAYFEPYYLKDFMATTPKSILDK